MKEGRTMKKFYFVIRSRSATNRLGEHSREVYWVDKFSTKKDVKKAYSNNTQIVKEIYTEEEFIATFGGKYAASIKRYWLA